MTIGQTCSLLCECQLSCGHSTTATAAASQKRLAKVSNFVLVFVCVLLKEVFCHCIDLLEIRDTISSFSIGVWAISEELMLFESFKLKSKSLRLNFTLFFTVKSMKLLLFWQKTNKIINIAHLNFIVIIMLLLQNTFQIKILYVKVKHSGLKAYCGEKMFVSRREQEVRCQKNDATFICMSF